MPCGVGLFFDTSSEKIVIRLRERLEEAGININLSESAYQPHITMTVYEDSLVISEKIRQEFDNFCASIPSFKITLSSLGVFIGNGVIFLGVTVTSQLLMYRRKLNHRFSHYLPHIQPNYRDGKWVPHCTLAYGLPSKEIARAVPVCIRFVLPLELEIQGMDFRIWSV